MSTHVKKPYLLKTASVISLAGIFAGNSLVLAQEGATTPMSITVSPVEYAAVKGNVDKFRQINWMKDGTDAGISHIAFVKDINKDISLDAGGSAFPKTENYDDHLILRNGDLAFLRIDYKAFRNYFDNTGGVYRDNSFDASLSGVKADAPDLNLDVNYFKLEAGLGKMTDPDLDVIYEHDAKQGAKSLTRWADATPTTGSVKKIGPSWEKINDTVDTITLKEKKEASGITFKGEQRAEIDYNHNFSKEQYLSTNMSTPSTANQYLTQEAYPDAKLFSSGISGEKWMLNDKTFVSTGYHYTHTHATELMRNQEFAVNGVQTNYAVPNGLFPVQSFWSYANDLQDQHVFYGNFNSNLTDNLDLAADLRYEYLGRKGVSNYLEQGDVTTSVPTNIDTGRVKNTENRTGEHVSFRYYGISRTSLYAEGDFQEGSSWAWNALSNSVLVANDFSQTVINRSHQESWTLGGRTVLNKFFTLTTQVRQHTQDNKYNLVRGTNPDLFLDELRMNGEDVSSVLNWKPWRWFDHSFRYQFSNNRYFPRDSSFGSGVAQYDVTKNHMLSSVFTYEATLQPIDPVLLVLSYSHVENYIKTFAASSASLRVPTFNSGDNSWLFSASYAPRENVAWINSAMYTLSDNYIDFSNGLPLGSSFKELTLSTGIQWKIHQWLTIGPTYEYASYKDNPLVGAGHYSAHIFKLDVKFDW